MPTAHRVYRYTFTRTDAAERLHTFLLDQSLPYTASLTTLAHTLHFSYTTAHRAINHLRDRGLVQFQSRGSSGTTVTAVASLEGVSPIANGLPGLTAYVVAKQQQA